MRQASITFLLFLFCLKNFAQTKNQNNYWFLFTTDKDEYGYKNAKGDTIIQPGKYSICYTDTFKTYAIVLKSGHGIIGINKKQNVLYRVFPFDNGPDYPSNGLFRIVENRKIGYADATTGKIIIKPQFDCAFPFKNGVAKVSLNCVEKKEGEHKYWESNNWFYIDKKGKKFSNFRKANH